ncbi:MAG TPA: Uma2 family endonuclease [Vicinamibacteria bacterium]
MATAGVISDEELLRLPKDGNKYELIDGELSVSPAGWAHERVTANLIAAMSAHAKAHNLGDVLGSNALYVLPNGNKRAPDVSFVAAGRLESAGGGPWLSLVPDLAVEVRSPNDSTRQILDTVGEYLAAGVRLVFVIDPERRSAAAYRSATHVREIGPGGALEGADVLAGFVCPLADVL